MSNFELPDSVSPYPLADKSAELSGEISVSRLVRLSENTAGVNAPVTASFHFYRDESGRRVIEGTVTAEVNLRCQRCLDIFSLALNGDFKMALVYNEEMAKALSSDLDPIIHLPGEDLDVALLAEDELLLCLPMYAMHEQSECRIVTSYGDEDAQGTEPKSSPFDVLKDLK